MFTTLHQDSHVQSTQNAERGESLLRKHYPAFDGLRGLAVLLVFCAHYGFLFLPAQIYETCWIGVDLFFALSGFLITGILYDSLQAPRYFRTFYIRRALRIFPLFYMFFLMIFLLRSVLQLHYSPGIWSFLFYVGNFLQPHHPEVGHIYVGRFHNTMVDFWPLWSLCVEEQFYLVWPLVLRLLPGRKAMMHFCLAAITATLCLRVALFYFNPSGAYRSGFLYLSTFTRCDTLLMGCWLALWLRGSTVPSLTRMRKIATGLMVVPPAVIALSFLTFGRRWPYNGALHPVFCTYGYDLVGLFAIGLILFALDETSTIHRALRTRFLASLGVVSYGFYFLHSFPLRGFATLHDVVLTGRFSGLVISLFAFITIYSVAWASFRFFESPFLALKGRLAPSHAAIKANAASMA